MKKFFACLLALVMALSLMACGGDTGTDDTNTGDDTPPRLFKEAVHLNRLKEQIMAILNDRFVAAPELAGTTWTFIGGYVQGKQMTEDQTNEVLSQLDNEYAFYFDENGAVSLTEGTDTVTAGTYTISEDGMLASISMDNDIKYAGSFIEQDDGPVMVALLDGTGMNALYFHLVVEG